MQTNADITIYNKYYDRELGHDVYSRSYLYGVNWQGTKAATVSDKGLLTADYVDIFIPFSVDAGFKTYMKPKEWASDPLSADYVWLWDPFSFIDGVITEGQIRERYFTFNNADIVVKGIVDFNLTGTVPNNLDALKKTHDDVFTIISNVECGLGSPGMHHWEIGAK